MFDMTKAFIIAIAIVSLALAGATPVAAQSKPIPRTADGHPDMTGVWWPGHD
jgi:ABC-type sugar transport system substrate-binding protein